MAKINFYLVLFILISGLSAKAQTIHLEFPYFKGQTYEFKIFQGDKQITLKADTIPKGGLVALRIPKEYEGYQGMAQWYLTNSKTGGGLDLIINNENFSVSCLDSVPSSESIIYNGTKESVFDKANYVKQQKLFEKHDAMLASLRAYPKEDVLYPIFDKEYNKIKADYANYIINLEAAPFYAAKFRQIVNLTMGIGTIISTDEKEKATNINDFIVNKLDFAALYTSNHWGGIINNWVQMHLMVIKNNALLIQDCKTLLHRMPNNKIYTDFVVSLTKDLTKVGKDNIIAELTPDIKKSNRLMNYDGVLTIYQQDLSGKAPDLNITTHIGNKEDHNHSTTVIKTAELNSKYTLLVFYKSGCGPCEETMQGLTGNYKDLVAKGIRIISLAADTDEQVFSNTSFSLPWVDKYCDLEGMNGINFKNYAIIGTPTMYILDHKGYILSKMATIADLLIWSKTN